MTVRPWENGHEILLASLAELGMPTRIVNGLPGRDVKLVGQFITMTEAEVLRIPNMGRKSLFEAKRILAQYGLYLGSDVAQWDHAEAYQERERLGWKLRRHISQSGGIKHHLHNHLEDELAALIASVEDARNAALLIKLYGFDGGKPRTLEEIGQAFSLTRERVRQLGERAKCRAVLKWRPMPRLKAAIEAIREVGPLSAAALSIKLEELRITRGPFHPDAIIEAAQFLGIKPGFSKFTAGGSTYYGLKRHRQSAEQVIAALRRETSSGGCTSIQRLALLVGLSLDDVCYVRQLLGSLSETVWLDQDHTWVMSSRATRNRLINHAQKVFCATSTISLSDLRSSLSRALRITYVPPSEVLAALIERNGLARREGDAMVCIRSMEEQRLGVNDSALLKTFRAYGSPLSREALERGCVDELGINPTSFYMHLSYSPIVTKLTTGVYALVGTHVAIGEVERIRSEYRAGRAPAEHGWNEAGELWCLLPIDRMFAHSGARTLSQYVAGLTVGLWDCIDRGGLSIGTVTVNGSFVTGLQDAIVVLAAEAGDSMLLSFNLFSRQLTVAIGGAELSDRSSAGMQDELKDTINEDD
jgi:RNA polymerase alpha subunit/sigma-70-like protein